jgi:hypothetical protein
LKETKGGKIRVSKPKAPVKQVSKLKYMVFDDKLKVQSIRPENMIGAVTLWAYNVKKRKLIVYHALDNKGFAVKGSTLLNWDPTKSYGKTLRKPEEKLKEFSEAGKVELRKFMDKIKGVEAKQNGRFSKDVLILKAY